MKAPLACALGLLLLRPSLLAAAGPQADGSFLAFSLREAARHIATDPNAEGPESLGGLTRVVGLVIDGDDAILVGRGDPGQLPATLSELCIALRARLQVGEWPMLSLDVDASTPASGLLAVNTRGGIRGSSVHAACLLADAELKRYCLQSHGSAGVPSYAELELARLHDASEPARWLQEEEMAPCADGLRGLAVRTESVEQVRFWFEPREPLRFSARDGVFFIADLHLGVGIQRLGASANSAPDTAATGFASALTSELCHVVQGGSDLGAAVQRLTLLYELVAVAEGCRQSARRPECVERLAALPVPPDPRASDTWPAVDVCAVWHRADGSQGLLQLTGGVRLSTAVDWLMAGDVSQLKTIVLAARPAEDALVWSLPLDGWRAPGSCDKGASPGFTPAPPQDAGAPATSVLAQAFTLAPAGSPITRPFAGLRDLVCGTPSGPQPGGVSMLMPLRTRSFRAAAGLERLLAELRGARPAPDALSWPAPEAEGGR